MVALGCLLIYRVVTSDSISLLLGVIGWLAIGSGVAFVTVGLVRRLRMADPDPQGQRPS
jgi:type IV secretory pathway TrbD component